MILELRTDGLLLAHIRPDNFFKLAYECIGTDIIERIRVNPKIEMWVDEEVFFKKDVKLNPYATRVLASISGKELAEPLYGHVMITGPDCSDLDIDNGQLEKIRMFLRN